MQFLIDIGLAVIGFVAGKKRNSFQIIRSVVDLLNLFLYYVVVPMIVFFSIFNAPSVDLYLFLVLFSILHMFILMVLSYTLSRIYNSDFRERITVTMLSSLPNAGYLAIPLSTLLLGSGYYVTPYTVAFNTIFPLFVPFIALKTSMNRVPDVGKSLIPLLAVIVSVLVRFFLPNIGSVDVVQSFSIFTSYAMRISFLIIGYEMANLTYSTIKHILRALLLIAIIKQPFSLIIARTMIYLAIVPREYLQGFILQSIMPPAINNIVIARMFKLNEELTASSITILTIVAVIASPIVLLI